MAAEEVVLDLFDSNWFGHKIISSAEKPNQVQDEIKEHHDHDHDHDHHDFVAPKNLKVRALSEQLLDSKIGSFFSSENSLSPSSVLAASAKLETIFSGKEVIIKDQDQDLDDHHDQDQEAKGELLLLSVKKKKRASERKRRKKRAPKLGGVLASKSLSELEFEELKGFMDLGFVFTEEECKDSKLVSMIPGLQRYCKKCTGITSSDHRQIKSEDDHDQDHHEAHDDDDGDDDKGVISRPYLSEAWDVLEQRRKKEQVVKPLVIDWKISAALGNEIYMKDQLRFWAHTVASTVR